MIDKICGVFKFSEQKKERETSLGLDFKRFMKNRLVSYYLLSPSVDVVCNFARNIFDCKQELHPLCWRVAHSVLAVMFFVRPDGTRWLMGSI